MQRETWKREECATRRRREDATRLVHPEAGGWKISAAREQRALHLRLRHEIQPAPAMALQIFPGQFPIVGQPSRAARLPIRERFPIRENHAHAVVRIRHHGGQCGVLAGASPTPSSSPRSIPASGAGRPAFPPWRDSCRGRRPSRPAKARPARCRCRNTPSRSGAAHQ